MSETKKERFTIRMDEVNWSAPTDPVTSYVNNCCGYDRLDGKFKYCIDRENRRLRVTYTPSRRDILFWKPWLGLKWQLIISVGAQPAAWITMSTPHVAGVPNKIYPIYGHMEDDDGYTD